MPRSQTRRLLLGCLAATVVGAGLSAHCHEAPGAGRDREAADAAAPAFGTVIDFELTDAGGNRVRAVDLRRLIAWRTRLS